MPIVSSETVIKGIQKNGNKTIQHKFVSSDGKVYTTASRHVPPDFDHDADRLIRVSKLENNLRFNEIKNCLKAAKKGMDIVDNPLQHQSRGELIQSLIRELYLMPIEKAAEFQGIVTRISNLTDAQLSLITEATPAKAREWVNDLMTIANIRSKYSG